MSISAKTFQYMAGELLKERQVSGHYRRLRGDERAVSLLGRKVLDAAMKGIPLSYSDWIVGSPFENQGEFSHFPSPPWDFEADQLAKKILEFLALSSASQNGFMITVMVVNAGGPLIGLPGGGFSSLAHTIENFRHDRDAIFRFNIDEHKALIDEHKRRISNWKSSNG